MQETKVLLVEDDRLIIENLTEFLKTEGFEVQCADGQEKAMELLEGQEFDLILLDITLAQGNGYSACTQIKSRYEIPIIFLTALDDEFSVVTGLEMGADDYISKPFRPRELVSRMRTVLRRTGKKAEAFHLPGPLRGSGEGNYDKKGRGSVSLRTGIPSAARLFPEPGHGHVPFHASGGDLGYGGRICQ